MKPLIGLGIALLSSALTIAAVIVLGLIFGKTFESATGIPLSWSLFGLLTLASWMTVILREK